MPSSVFRATLPVNPSQTITSQPPPSSSRPSTLPSKPQRARLEQGVRLERERVALLRLLSDREQPHPRPGDAEHLLREDRAHVAELEQVLGAGLGVGAGVDEDGRAVLGRDDDRDAGAEHAGQAPDVEEARSQDGAGVPGRDDGVGCAVADGAHGADERGLRLAAHRLGGLVVHLDDPRRDDELEPVRVEAGRPVDDGNDLLGCRGADACDDLVRGMVAPRASTATRIRRIGVSQATERECRAVECRGLDTSCRWGRRDGPASAIRSSGTR